MCENQSRKDKNTFKYTAALVKKSWRSMQVVQCCYRISADTSLIRPTPNSNQCFHLTRSCPLHGNSRLYRVWSPWSLTALAPYTIASSRNTPCYSLPLCFYQTVSFFQQALLSLSHLANRFRLLWIQVQVQSVSKGKCP